MKILFIVKLGREGTFKPKTGNETLHEISSDNGARVVNFATSKNLSVKNTMSPHCKTRKTELRGFSLQVNYTDRATATCRRSWCRLLQIESVTWSAHRIPWPLISIF
jgi:hypothetical protein